MGWFLPVLSAIGGSLVSGLFGQASANKSMDFQREALQNSIQWKVADMKKAGLNPILASGMNTSVPSGATAQMPDLGGTLSKAISSSVELEKLQAEIDKLKAEKEKLDSAKEVDKSVLPVNEATADQLRANTQLIKKNTGLAEASISKVFAETRKIFSEVRNIDRDTDLYALRSRLLQAQALLNTSQASVKAIEAQMLSAKDLPKAKVEGKLYDSALELIQSEDVQSLEKVIKEKLAEISGKIKAKGSSKDPKKSTNPRDWPTFDRR